MSVLVRGAAEAIGRSLTPMVEAASPLDAQRSLAEFAEGIGAPLAPHQTKALTLERRVTAIVAPRQAGKSRGVSVLALHRSLQNKGHHTLIVSAGLAAAQRVIATIVRMALQADPSAAQLEREPTSELIVFTNGSTIRCVPASEKAIRGWTIDLLVIDEAAQVADPLILGAAIPTTSARPDARIVLVSSPILAAGAFYRFVLAGREGDPGVRSFKWMLTESPWITEATIAAARAAMTQGMFAAEFEAEFPDSGTGLLIPRGWITAAQQRDLPGRERGAFGVDVADEGDDWTVIYRNRGGAVRLVDRVNGQTTMATADQVASLLREAPAAVAVVDAIGVGAGVASRLQQMGLRAVPFKGSHKARKPDQFTNRRAETFWALRGMFERGEVDLDPADHELADELAMLRYEITSGQRGGRIQMESKESMRARGLVSPDRADAVCYATTCAPLVLDAVVPGSLGEVRRPARREPDAQQRAVRVRPGEAASIRKRPM